MSTVKKTTKNRFMEGPSKTVQLMNSKSHIQGLFHKTSLIKKTFE